MKIAVMGIRGLPLENVSFGGFEAFIAGLAPRLVRAGHEVIVYCRRDLYHNRPAAHDGVRLRYVPSIEHKAFGTPLHMSLCTIDAVFRRYDAILVLNSGNGLQCAALRAMCRSRTALNVDGVEWERGKWGWFGRSYFKFASRVGARVVHTVIADSRAIADIYWRTFGVQARFIPYAADVYDRSDDDKLRGLGLTPLQYGLVVGRLIPENFTDVLIEGFQLALPGERLVVAGGSNYASAFHDRLKALMGPQVLALGHVADQGLLWQLFKHSRIYLHGHSVGGTNPALLQALAAGCRIGATDVVFNREVLGNAGYYFHPNSESVRDVVRRLWSLSDDDVGELSRGAQHRIMAGGYSWENVVSEYEAALRGP